MIAASLAHVEIAIDTTIIKLDSETTTDPLVVYVDFADLTIWVEPIKSPQLVNAFSVLASPDTPMAQWVEGIEYVYKLQKFSGYKVKGSLLTNFIMGKKSGITFKLWQIQLVGDG